MNRDELHEQTRLTHAPEVTLPQGNRPILPPIYQSAKFSLAEGIPVPGQFIYTRVSNPTLRELELSLAELQGTEDGIVLASGMAAITGVLLGILKTGDHVISFRELYRPGRIFVRSVLERFGIQATMLSLGDLGSLEKAVTPRTRLLYFESPTNPHLEIADIKRIVAFAKKHKLIVMMDGTFGGPHQHRDLGIDVFVHSLTKFVNGHGDVIAGAILGRKDLLTEIRPMIWNLGATLDPHAAYLIQRGLKTYHLRYERQAQTAEIVARKLAAHPKIRKVFYPGLESHPGHALAKSQMSSMGGILSFELAPEVGEGLAFCHRMKLLQFTASVGSAESLICPTLMFFGDDLSAEEAKALGINAHTVRLSVGLEHPDDILRDLWEALG